MLQWFLERQAGNGAAVLVPKLMPNQWPPFLFAPLLYCLTIDTKGSTRWLSTLMEDGFVGCGVCWLNAFWDLRKQRKRWFTAIGTYFSCSPDCSSMYMWSYCKPWKTSLTGANIRWPTDINSVSWVQVVLEDTCGSSFQKGDPIRLWQFSESTQWIPLG